jgi:hypothetical protein
MQDQPDTGRDGRGDLQGMGASHATTPTKAPLDAQRCRGTTSVEPLKQAAHATVGSTGVKVQDTDRRRQRTVDKRRYSNGSAHAGEHGRRHCINQC